MISHAPILKTLLWRDEAATRAFAQALARQDGLGQAFIALHGALGTGKTTLVRHLLRALGEQGRVKSPTYAVVESYDLPNMPVWHFDFYRFADPREWEDAGFRDIFAGPGLKLVEWPEKAAGMLPPSDLEIYLQAPSEQARQVTLRAHSALGRALLAAAEEAA